MNLLLLESLIFQIRPIITQGKSLYFPIQSIFFETFSNSFLLEPVNEEEEKSAEISNFMNLILLPHTKEDDEVNK